MNAGRAARSALASLTLRTGALSLMTRARRGGRGPLVHVVGFHRVVDEMPSPSVIPSLCICTKSFARICAIAQKRFEVLALDEAAAALAGKRPLARDALVITFDDGYRDVYLRARPILRALGLPATVFVPTGLVDTAQPLLHDRLYALLMQAHKTRAAVEAAPLPRVLRVPAARATVLLYRRADGPLDALEHLIATLPAPSLGRLADALEDLVGSPPPPDEGALVMSRRELRACADDGIALGAHTVDHVVLTHVPPARVHRELARPREELAAIAGRPCTAFAYCNGRHSPSVVAAVRRAGYAIAVTTRDAPNRAGADPFLLSRKVMWEGHVRGARGQFSWSLAAAQLHDLFGALGLTRPVDGGAPEETRWRHNA